MALDVINHTFGRSPGRGAVSRTPSAPQKSKFDKQREEEVIRNAHARGYLRAATTKAIWESIGEKCELEDVNYLNMSHVQLHAVKSIDMCVRLKICVLHSNYLTSFDALEACRELVFLDLHSNQVREFGKDISNQKLGAYGGWFERLSCLHSSEVLVAEVSKRRAGREH